MLLISSSLPFFEGDREGQLSRRKGHEHLSLVDLELPGRVQVIIKPPSVVGTEFPGSLGDIQRDRRGSSLELVAKVGSTSR